MHAEVEDFLHRHSMALNWREARVVEIGSLNVNGECRAHVPGGWREWVGIDVIEGPGVDVVAHAADGLAALGEFDIAVSTEALEHDSRWRETVAAVIACLKPGGGLVLTCAGTGRPPHAADGSGPPHPGEYYANVGLPELLPLLERHGMSIVHAEAGPPGDTRVVAVKS